MARLIYATITSLDGYLEDEGGNIDWAAPDEEVFEFINELQRTIGTYLYGRRMYETMVYWENDVAHEESPVEQDFRTMWRSAEKIVYSTSLTAASSANTRMERTFDANAIRALKTTPERDITVNGANLAAQAFRAGLVDECQLFLTPIVLGGGKPALPSEVRLELELLDERRFDNGVVFLRYRTSSASSEDA